MTKTFEITLLSGEKRIEAIHGDNSADCWHLLFSELNQMKIIWSDIIEVQIQRQIKEPHNILDVVKNMNITADEHFGFQIESKSKEGKLFIASEDNLIQVSHFYTDSNVMFSYLGEEYDKVYVFFNNIVLVNSDKEVSKSVFDNDFTFDEITFTGAVSFDCCACDGTGFQNDVKYNWEGSPEEDLFECEEELCKNGEIEIDFN